MTKADSLRFRLLLDAAKHLIYAVDDTLACLHRIRYGANPLPNIGRPVRLPRPRKNSQTSTLAAWLVEPAGPPEAAVLLLHGIGDRIEYWRSAQAYLAAHGYTSLIFHYSGYAGSGGATTPEELEADVQAAYRGFRSLLPPDLPLHLLAFSLGSGLAVDVLPSLQPAPASLILAEAYTTLRQAAARMARAAAFLSVLIPDLWRSVATIARIQVPILIVHSRGDTLFPVAMAEQLHRAANARPAPTTLAILEGFSHNAIYQQVPPVYWVPILKFLRECDVKG